ncbi:MAG TPA: carboxypeptidase regulatory-like domain-containing protein, partial [Terriglobales bacterium]|nr:carboxypeptidase regulatory-like domain-containing protein [Terriglobales bacterium]
MDATGPAVFPDAQIQIQGPITKETRSDAAGKFLFEALPTGNYKLTAKAPGLSGATEVTVTAGSTSTTSLNLEVQVVSSSVTVTADASPAPESSSQSATITAATIEHAPSQTERFDSYLPLVPGVVRGPDGLINMKGTRATQSGWLVNSANVTDPATGGQAMNLPIDAVSSVKVVSNPYDPAYGKFTGAVATVETRTGDLEKRHLSVQNLFPRLRDRDGHIVGIGAFTPRLTFTGPLIKDRVAVTQSFEYRFVRTPVESLPPLQRDTKLESFDSFTQYDVNISPKQTATLSVALFPQKLDYVGLNTFVPQPSTPNLHQRGYQTSLQDHYIGNSGSLLTSGFNYERFDADVLRNSSDPYRLLVETTEGGFFNTQKRDTDRVQWQEIYQPRQKQFWGTHELKTGIDLSYSSYDGRQQFSPVDIVGSAGYALQRIEFGPPTRFSVDQTEFSWFIGDGWTVRPRLSFDLGLRFDHDSVTDATHSAPRAGFTVALTRDRKTLLKAGAGFFYDRVPLNAPAFPDFPDRTILSLSPTGGVLHSTAYDNVISGSLANPKSQAWNAEIDRQLASNLIIKVAYQQRNTFENLVVTPNIHAANALLSLSSRGEDFYRELQFTGRYQFRQHTLNASYVRSKAFGDLNDFNQFFGNNPQAVIQPNSRGRLAFDAPQRFLFWGEFSAPWKLTVLPVWDLHTGFPYSVENQWRQFVGPRNTERFS